MRTRQIITLVVLALNLGLHWAALQSVAWVSMIVRYSQTTTFQEALVQTFDGQHPCSLCEFVADGKKAEQEQQDPELPLLKFDFLCDTSQAFVFDEFPFARIEGGDQTILTRVDRPPFPPPRFA